MRWLFKKIFGALFYILQQLILTLAVFGAAFGIYVIYDTLVHPGQPAPINVPAEANATPQFIADGLNIETSQYVAFANDIRVDADLPLLSPSPNLVRLAEQYAATYAEMDDVYTIDFAIVQADLNNVGYTLGGIIYQLPAYIPQQNPVTLAQHMISLTSEDLLDERLGSVGFASAPAPDGRGHYVSLLLAQPLRLTAPGTSYGIIGGASQESQQLEILALLNAAREDRGLSTLRINSVLTQAAYLHSLDQATYHNMSHTGSDGSAPQERAQRAGYRGDFIGENVLERPNRHASGAFDQWWNSDTHRTAMLHPNFTEVGIAYAIAPDGQHYYTMLLGRP